MRSHMRILAHRRRSLVKGSLASRLAVPVAGVTALILLTRGSFLSWQGFVDEAATLLETLVLAAGVVLIANYLSGGRKPHGSDRIGIRYDNDLRLDI